MNFFERELRRLVDACETITEPVFTGRACYCNSKGYDLLKLEFVSMSEDNAEYESLRVSVINRNVGEVDVLVFRFRDIWGFDNTKGVESENRHITNHLTSIYTDTKGAEWGAYKPTDEDFKQLACEIDTYIKFFEL